MVGRGRTRSSSWKKILISSGDNARSFGRWQSQMLYVIGSVGIRTTLDSRTKTWLTIPDHGLL